jgi:hypothetical protein
MKIYNSYIYNYIYVYTYICFFDNYGTISYICCDIHIIYGIFSFLAHVLLLCTSVNLHVLIRFSILTIQLLGYPHFRNPPYIYIILNVIRIHYEFPIYFLVFPISLPSFTRKPRPFPAPGVAPEPVAGRSARAAAAAAASLGDEAGGFRPSPGVNKKAGFLHGKMGKP